MVLYDYLSESKERRQFSLKDIGISINDPIPQTFEKDGQKWHKVMDTTSLFVSNEGKEVYVNSIDYEQKTGEKLGSSVWVDNEQYFYERTVAGIPNFADFKDTFRQMHDDKYHVNFTKPPLQVESKTWGYGLT